MTNQYLIDDGIIVWFNGPSWDDVAERVFQQAEAEVQNSAFTNAPWEDRSGNARRGLTSEVNNDNGDIVLTLAHTVDYGLWLEVIQNGRFAIIMPTLEREAPQIINEAIEAMWEARQGVNYW